MYRCTPVAPATGWPILANSRLLPPNHLDRKCSFLVDLRPGALPEGEHPFPIRLHVDDRSVFGTRFVERLDSKFSLNFHGDLVDLPVNRLSHSLYSSVTGVSLSIPTSTPSSPEYAKGIVRATRASLGLLSVHAEPAEPAGARLAAVVDEVVA
ncbi:MAG: hypothetical protein ACREX9_04870 [Gammaproteobacteria bacterium]